MVIRPVTALTDQVVELIEQSRQYQQSIYPAESIHQDAPDDLINDSMYFVGAFQGDVITGIGGVKLMYDDCHYGEIKNLFVSPDYRGQGVSRIIMGALEKYLLDSNLTLCRLETGVNEPESIGLYRSLGYHKRGCYGDYNNDPLSIFMEKVIE